MPSSNNPGRTSIFQTNNDNELAIDTAIMCWSPSLTAPKVVTYAQFNSVFKNKLNFLPSDFATWAIEAPPPPRFVLGDLGDSCNQTCDAENLLCDDAKTIELSDSNQQCLNAAKDVIPGFSGVVNTVGTIGPDLGCHFGATNTLYRSNQIDAECYTSNSQARRVCHCE